VHVLALLNPTSLVQSSGYIAIFLLSVAQSCCIPTSSELTLGFAGVLAAEGKLSLPGAIVAGVAGEVVGAFIAWVIGRSGGRAFINRWGKYILVSHADLDRAEAWYDRHGSWGVLVSRLLPVIRNFVALPAGVAEVPLVRFGLLTLVGSAIWDSGMALIGYAVGQKYNSVMKGFSDAGYLLGAAAVVAIAVFIWHRYRSYKANTSELEGRQAGPGAALSARPQHSATGSPTTRPVPVVPAQPATGQPSGVRVIPRGGDRARSGPAATGEMAGARPGDPAEGLTGP
jgi:membrane protein DedA with SNARE-associated domain